MTVSDPVGTRVTTRARRLAYAVLGGVIAAVALLLLVGPGRRCDVTPLCPADGVCPAIRLAGPCSVTGGVVLASVVAGVVVALVVWGLVRVAGEVRSSRS